MRVVNTVEMQKIEEVAREELGLTESLIIENIGIRGASKTHHQLLKDGDFGEIVLFVGRGNNGSDGLAIGRHLREYGHRVRAFMLFDQSDCSEELRRQAKMAHRMGVKISEVRESEEVASYFQATQEEYFVVDAIFGMGVRLPLSNFIDDIVKIINRDATLCVSVDIPSGITGDTGASEGAAIIADYTLAVGVPKVGYYSSNGAQHAGEVIILSAGLPPDMVRKGDKNLIGKEFIGQILGKRNKFAHKNSFGHTLLLGGSPGQVGALVLAANGALKVGSGLVTAATWEESFAELNMKLNPEIMSRFFPRSPGKLKHMVGQLGLFDTVVVGPGLGRGEEARYVVQEVLMNFSGPVVLDADAIHCLRDDEGCRLLKNRQGPLVMTPHLGEFASFTQQTVPEVEAAPIANLRDLVEKIGGHVVLKGPGTYIGMPTGDIYINHMPNSGMATGGSGDVLAGVIGGLMAQAVTKNQSFNLDDLSDEWDACVVLGVFVHSIAGHHAAEEMGVRAMTAWSIINHIHHAFSDIKQLKSSG